MLCSNIAQLVFEREARVAGVDPFGSQSGPMSNPSTPHSNRLQETLRSPQPHSTESNNRSRCRSVLMANQESRPADVARPVFREIFARKMRLTEAATQGGAFTAGEPVGNKKDKEQGVSVNLFNSKTFSKLKGEAARANQVWHFAMPGSSFSVLQHSNGGTRRASKPQGNHALPREIEGNLLLDRVMTLIRILEAAGSKWTLENPLTSYLWKMPSIEKKMREQRCHEVHLHQCSYGLMLRDSQGR